MGKLSLYKSKQYFKRKHRKVTSGRPSKISKFSNRNKDIDTTWSYSDNCENDMSQGTRTHAINFYCGAVILFYSILFYFIVILCWLDTEHLQIPVHHPQIILLLKTVMMEVPVRDIQSILKMRKMCGTAHMPRIVWPC